MIGLKTCCLQIIALSLDVGFSFISDSNIINNSLVDDEVKNTDDHGWSQSRRVMNLEQNYTQYLRAFYDSLLRHMAAIIKSKGGPMKYYVVFEKKIDK